MATTRGIKKVSENILSDGRAIIVTEKDKDNYVWADIPNGSLFIDTTTGIMQVKIEGESDWVPAGLRNDGTLCIAKDTKLVTEVYTIVNPDEGDGNFSCKDGDGNTRHFPLTDDGYPVFYLEEGSYQMLRNQISLMIDDCLYRSQSSGGLTELSETKIILNEKLVAGQEVTITYSNVVRIGNPYPRVFINDNEPDVQSEIGDLWIDTDATLEENDYLGEGNYEANKTLSWDRITGKPTTTSEYKIYDEIKGMIDNHRVDFSMLDNVPQLPNQIDAHTIQGHSPGINANNVLLIPSDGHIPSSCLPIDVLKKADVPDIRIGPSVPSSPINDKTIWFCTASGDTCVKVYTNNNWLKFGAVWS